MNVLITGAGGMLAHDLIRLLGDRPVTALRRDQLDITDPDAVDDAVRGHDAVINCAAWTRVDDAETDEAAAFAVNATGAGLLAEAAARRGAAVVQVSTDYVFDGRASSPYTEDHPRSPVSAYGRTKAEGERRVLGAGLDRAYVVRTAWTYGAGGSHFPGTMLRLAETHPTVSVVDDQRGQPTWTTDVAERILALLDTDAPTGVYHATSSGEATWFDLARAVFTEAGLDPARVLPTDSSSFVRPAPRPAYSVLGHGGWSAIGMPDMPHWRDALGRARSAGVLERE